MTEINCAEACVNGCALGDDCPNIEARQQASQFVANTSLDKMLELAQERLEKLYQRPPEG